MKLKITKEQLISIIKEELEEMHRSNDAPWLPQKMMELGWKMSAPRERGYPARYSRFEKVDNGTIRVQDAGDGSILSYSGENVENVAAELAKNGYKEEPLK